MKKVFEGSILEEWSKTEDGGRAKIAHFEEDGDEDADGLYVLIQSWSETKEHPELDSLVGKKVRVTVELIES